MKKPVLAVFGVAGACAACCAIPLAIPLWAGLSAAGMGWLGWETLASGSSLLLAGAGMLTVALIAAGVMARRSRKNSCAVQASDKACAVNTDKTQAGTCACAPGTT